jgi:hypothetical protein
MNEPAYLIRDERGFFVAVTSDGWTYAQAVELAAEIASDRGADPSSYSIERKEVRA